MLSHDHNSNNGANQGDEPKNLAEELLSKGRGFFERKIESLQKKHQQAEGSSTSDAMDEEGAGDEMLSGIQRFIRSGGADVLNGKQTLALLTKTARHVNAKAREFQRRGAQPGTGGAIEEITAFFQQLRFVRYKRDPAWGSGEEMSELNLELLPRLNTVELSGITVIHVKSGGGITHLVMTDGALFLDGVKVFPNCTDLELEQCDVLKILRAVEGPVTGLSMTRCTLPTEALQDPTPFARLTRLEIMDCGLQAVPEFLKGLQELRTLNLSGNTVTDVRNLQECSKLEVLDLSGNKLANIEGFFEHSGQCQAELLQEVDLSDNPLACLKGLGPWMKSLRVLNLASCQVADWLQELPRLGRFRTLKSLILSGNPAYSDPAPRQRVLEILSVLDNPQEFLLDGTKLNRSELKAYSTKAAAEQPGSPSEQAPREDAWPCAEGAGECVPLPGPQPTSPTTRREGCRVVTRRRPVRQHHPHQRSTAEQGCGAGSVATAEQAVQAASGPSANADFQQEVLRIARKRLDTPQYKAVECNDFRSWRNGLGLCALLHDCCGRWIDYHNLSPAKPSDNIRRAVESAYRHLGVPKPVSTPDFMQDGREAAAYTSLLLLAIQSWEGEQYRKAKMLNERLVEEVLKYRSQRQRDKQRLEGIEEPPGSDALETTLRSSVEDPYDSEESESEEEKP